MAQFIKMDDRRKMSESETHVYFVGGPFSQWHRSQLDAELPSPIFEKKHKFNCAEQYMMACKACVFEDYDALLRVMQEMDPSQQKLIGRSIENYVDDDWRHVARELVYLGNMAKFSQNADLGEELRATGNKIIVEGAWYDAVWGVKLAYNDPLILDSANWQGTNWLGEVLMRVRQDLFGLEAAQV